MDNSGISNASQNLFNEFPKELPVETIYSQMSDLKPDLQQQ